MSFMDGNGSSKSKPPPGLSRPHLPRKTNMASYLTNFGIRLGKVIGEGSYSKVRICAWRNPDGKDVNIACKVISKQKASGDFVQKFMPRELEIVTRLSNPNIISVYDVVEFDQHVFIFMDYCNKGDLLEFIKRKGFLSERRSQNYFYQILSAVRYLHGLDLAHRDLKCENILLSSSDSVKISDFGFSRYCHDSSGKRILSNTYCGSAAYAAPEILQGTMYNPKLYDMWSLGCIVFIMLTGHMPYDESNVQQMLKNQLERVLSYPSQVEGLITKHAKRFIRHLLEPDVTRRANIEQAFANSWLSIGPISLKCSSSKQLSAPTADSGNLAIDTDAEGDFLVQTTDLEPGPSDDVPFTVIQNGQGHEISIGNQAQGTTMVDYSRVKTYCNKYGRQDTQQVNPERTMKYEFHPQSYRKSTDKPLLPKPQNPSQELGFRFRELDIPRQSTRKLSRSKPKFL